MTTTSNGRAERKAWPASWTAWTRSWTGWPTG